jgi:hypothetical protein
LIFINLLNIFISYIIVNGKYIKVQIINTNKTVPKGIAAVLLKLQAIELIILHITNKIDGNNKAVIKIFLAHYLPPKL